MLSSMKNTCSAHEYHEKQKTARCFGLLWLSRCFALSSLGITGISLHWFESYLSGRSFRVAWGGEVSTEHQLVTGFLRDQFFDPSSSPHTLHHWVPSYNHMVSHIISMLMTYSSISHFDQMIQHQMNGRCTNLRLPGGYLGMDERTSTTAQPGKD